MEKALLMFQYWNKDEDDKEKCKFRNAALELDKINKNITEGINLD